MDMIWESEAMKITCSPLPKTIIHFNAKSHRKEGNALGLLQVSVVCLVWVSEPLLNFWWPTSLTESGLTDPFCSSILPKTSTKRIQTDILYDNALAHQRGATRKFFAIHRCKLLATECYSLDQVPSDYALLEQYFSLFRHGKLRVDDLFKAKPGNFIRRSIHKVSKKIGNTWTSPHSYFEEQIWYQIFQKLRFLR